MVLLLVAAPGFYGTAITRLLADTAGAACREGHPGNSEARNGVRLPYDWERLVVYAGAAIPAPNQPALSVLARLRRQLTITGDRGSHGKCRCCQSRAQWCSTAGKSTLT